MAIDYGRFHRLTARAQEIVDAPGASPVVVSVYQHATRSPLSRFAAAHAAVDDAITRLNRANLDLSQKLPAVIRHSDTALSAIKAVAPETALPAPLRSQPSDTDKRMMLRRVLKLLDDHRGQDWADALLQGDFGSVAGAFIQDLDVAIQAAAALQAARRERVESFEPAWKAFLAYKRLIRSSFGSSSRQYRRLLVRTLDAGDQEEASAPQPLPQPQPQPQPRPQLQPQLQPQPQPQPQPRLQPQPQPQPLLQPQPQREEPRPAAGSDASGVVAAAEGVSEGAGSGRGPGAEAWRLRSAARLRQLASRLASDIVERSTTGSTSSSWMRWGARLRIDQRRRPHRRPLDSP